MGVSAAEALPAGAKRSAPAVALRDVTITFRFGAGVTYTAVSEATLSVADGGIHRHRWPDRLRRRSARGASRRVAGAVSAPVPRGLSAPLGVASEPARRVFCPDADDRTLVLPGQRSPEREAPTFDLPPDDRRSARPVRGSRAGAELARGCARSASSADTGTCSARRPTAARYFERGRARVKKNRHSGIHRPWPQLC